MKWATRAFAWPTLVVALGYPPYFVLRRRINADSLAAFAVEIVLLCPVAFAMVATSTTQVADHPVLWAALLPGLGVLSTLALASYLKASRMLPMALFGILGYVGRAARRGVAAAARRDAEHRGARDVRADLGRRRAHRVAQRDADAAPARARINGDREAAAHAACRVAHRKTPAPQRSDPSMLTANWHRADASLATLPALRDKARACNRTEDSVALCYLGSPRIGH